MEKELAALPKVELHVHLEGTIAAETATVLARSHGESPERDLALVDGEYPHPFADFVEFVTLYQAVSRQVRTPDDLGTIASAFARAQSAQNVRYTEVHFTALTHVRNGMEAGPMWRAVTEGLAEGGPDTEIVLIVDAVRDQGTEHALETIKLVESSGAPVVGLGLSGIEGSVPERDFLMLRSAADSMGLGLAVHAGEAGGPENVRAAIDDLGADRIGHGIASVRDPQLVERLARDRVPVEVCPSSNVALQFTDSLESHPFPDMWRAGMNVTINSDDPPFFSTTLSEELAHARRLADLNLIDLAELQRRAARSAFAPEDTKARLIDSIDRWAEGT